MAGMLLGSRVATLFDAMLRVVVCDAPLVWFRHDWWREPTHRATSWSMRFISPDGSWSWQDTEMVEEMSLEWARNDREAVTFIWKAVDALGGRFCDYSQGRAASALREHVVSAEGWELFELPTCLLWKRN